MFDTKPYNVYYNDGSYLTFDLIDVDYQRICKGLLEGWNALQIRDGVLRLTDVRSIILQRAPIESDPNEGLPSNLEPESYAWINEQRERELENEKEDDDVDY